jgi:hypothetical protein
MLLHDLPENLFTFTIWCTLFLLYYAVFLTEMKEHNLEEMQPVKMLRESNQTPRY